MPGGDFLQELLRSSLEQSPSGEAPGFLGTDPTTGAADRASSLEAIKHYMVTGQPPAEVQSPSYGPIGGILQKIGLRSQYRPVNPGLREDMTLAGKIQSGQEEQSKMDKIQQIQQGAAEFGGEYGSKLAGIEGVPEVGTALPQGMKGLGELRATDRDIKLQGMLQSRDIKEQEIGVRELAMQTREAISAGNLDRAMQLMQLQQQKFSLQEQQAQEKPVDTVYNHMLDSLDRRLQSLDSQLAQTTEGSSQEAYILKQKKALEDRQRRLLEGFGQFKNPKDITGAYYQGGEEPTPSGVKPPPKGVFD